MPETRLIVQYIPMPPGFNENFPDWERSFASRLRVTSPFGPIQQQIGGLEPTSNVGIWWKDGSKPYTWDETDKEYKPADVSESISTPFWYGSTTPATQDPKLWCKTFDSGLRAQWLHWNGTAWTRLPTLPNFGTTAERPLNPEDYEQFWDTSIDCLIHWERAAWRTVSGTRYDIKFVDTGDVDYATAVTNSLARNPGWEEIDAAFRGRAVGIAGSGAGLTVRAPRATAGTEEVVLTADQLPAHSHNVTYQEPDEGGDPAYPAGSIAADVNPLTQATTSVGSGLGHPNVPPTVWFVGLRKT